MVNTLAPLIGYLWLTHVVSTLPSLTPSLWFICTLASLRASLWFVHEVSTLAPLLASLCFFIHVVSTQVFLRLFLWLTYVGSPLG